MSRATPASAPPASWRFEAIDTTWEIVTTGELSAAVRDAVRAQIEEFDRAWSRFRHDSVVTALSRTPGAVAAPPDASLMLDLFDLLSRATGGAVSPLVGAALENLGYDASYTLRDRLADHGPLAAPKRWHELLTWSDRTLELRDPAVIDIGALGKGRLVDLVLAIVGRAVTGDATVDAGGDLAVRGSSQRIGLEHPFDSRRAIGTWEVRDAALCASATNRRAWPGAQGAGLHHVLDARTGLPVHTYAATWATAADAMTADAVSTALFFDGGPRFAHDVGAEWVRMTTDGAVEWSRGCDADLFVSDHPGAGDSVGAVTDTRSGSPESRSEV